MFDVRVDEIFFIFFLILKIINFSKFFPIYCGQINKTKCDKCKRVRRGSATRPLTFPNQFSATPAGGVRRVWFSRRLTLSPPNQLWVRPCVGPGDDGDTSGGAVLRERSRRSARVRTLTRSVKWPRVAALIESAPLAAQWLPLPSSRADWIIRNSPRSPSPSSRGTHECLWAQVCAS